MEQERHDHGGNREEHAERATPAYGLRRRLVVALAIPHDAPDQGRLDADEDRRSQDQDDHEELMNILTLGRDSLLGAARQQQQHQREPQTSGTRADAG